MVSTKNLVLLMMKIVSLMVLSSNQVPTSVYTGLLSRLYKKAADSNRPLVVIFDSDFLLSNQIHKRPSKSLDNIGKELDSERHKEVDLYLNRLLESKHQPKLITPKFKEIKIKNLDDQYQGLLPLKKKKRGHKNKGGLRSPIIRSLLRISNNLRCQARNECDNGCSAKYSGSKEKKCNDICEANYECEPEVEDDCDECSVSSENDCNGGGCQGSTKGYAGTEPKAFCPEC